MQFILGFLEGGVHTNEVEVWKTHKNCIKYDARVKSSSARD